MQKLLLKRLRSDLEKICKPYNIEISLKKTGKEINGSIFCVDTFLLYKKSYQERIIFYSFIFSNYHKAFLFCRGSKGRSKALKMTKRKTVALEFLKRFITKNYKRF
jgi:hypothetical protein